MRRSPRLWLIDAPLVDTRSQRTAATEQMANALVRDGTAGDEADAMRTLRGAGFQMADIVMLLDDARQVAIQDLVAREMARP